MATITNRQPRAVHIGGNLLVPGIPTVVDLDALDPKLKAKVEAMAEADELDLDGGEPEPPAEAEGGEATTPVPRARRNPANG